MSRSAMTEELRRSVGRVTDPELRRSVADLGSLREVQVGRRGDVMVRLAVATADGEQADALVAAVRSAAQGIEGTRRVEVVLDSMNDAERAAARAALPPHVPDASPARAIYAVASGKGGVGKSSIAANLAVALAARGQRVGLIDADVWGYSVPQLFAVRRSPSVLDGKMLPVTAHGVQLMSLGFFVEDNEPVVWRGPMLHKALTQFVEDTCWDDLDVLLLDLPPGTGDVTLSVLELLPEASLVAVTTPQPAARVVASRVGAMAREVRMPVSGVIENMSELVCPQCSAHTALFGSGGGRQLADELGCDLLGQVPLDVQLRDAGDHGTPVVTSYPDSHAARALTSIADRLRPVRRGLAGRSLGLTPVAR